MVRKRFTADEKADCDKILTDRGGDCCTDSNKQNAVKGYKKTAFILFLFIAVYAVKIFFIDFVFVSGNSMADTFKSNDILLVNVQDEEIKRYDVVVAKESGTRIIKRVIALPFETVQIIDGIIYVNGEKIAKYNSGTDRAGVAESCYQLGEAEYFLMGDNRSGSMDSRDFGSVKKENINGVVVYQLYPFSDMRSVPHGEEERN